MIAGKVAQEDMDEYNNAAYKNYNEKALDACPNCGRTFLPDRLLVHLKSCNKAHGRSDASPDPKAGFKSSVKDGASPNKQPAFVQKPKSIICYIW